MKECGVLLSKMGEMFIQDIVLKAIHHRHNISKDKTNFVIEVSIVILFNCYIYCHFTFIYL